MKKRLLSVFLLVTLVFAGCGSSSGKESASYIETVNNDYSAEWADAEEGFESGSTASYSGDSVVVDTVKDNRKIIYNSYISIETKSFDDDAATLKSLVKSNNGYFESSNIDGSLEYSTRYANYTLRIPVEKYSSFMEAVGSIGSVVSKSESAEDVTSTYVDVDTRISSLRTKLERLEELEEKAEDLETLLTIEDRINDTQYDIERYTAQLNTLKDKISYCTVDVNLCEVSTYTPVVKDTFLSRVKEAFVSTWLGFVDFLQGLVIVIIHITPYIIFIAIILLIVMKVRKSLKNKKVKANLEEKVEEAKEE